MRVAPPEGAIMFKLINSRGDAALSPFAGRSHVRGAQRPSLSGSLMAGARWLAAGLAKELAARRAMRSLASLDDRMLRDIGLERGQIDHAVRQGRQAAKRMDDARSDLIRWA
jgi:uncharacterized protein YjiS (DUF1127 family)